MKKRPRKKPWWAGRDIIDPHARPWQVKIHADGKTVTFPKGWTKKQRDDWRKSAFARAPYRER